MTGLQRLIDRVRRRPLCPDGGHHYHTVERGWDCCHCRARVPARQPAPDRTTSTGCALPPAPSFTLPAAPSPSGRRVSTFGRARNR